MRRSVLVRRTKPSSATDPANKGKGRGAAFIAAGPASYLCILLGHRPPTVLTIAPGTLATAQTASRRRHT